MHVDVDMLSQPQGHRFESTLHFGKKNKGRKKNEIRKSKKLQQKKMYWYSNQVVHIRTQEGQIKNLKLTSKKFLFSFCTLRNTFFFDKLAKGAGTRESLHKRKEVTYTEFEPWAAS